MKRQIISILFVVVFCLNSFGYVYSEPDMDIFAETAILMDGATGEVLYDKKIHQQMYPASTTKILTAILAIENSKLDQIVIIDSETPFTEGSRIYLLEGEQLTVEQLLNALLLESANDAAIALAKHVSGSVEEFSKLMNEKAAGLGALNSNFVNPNGLPDENHVTTAYDLAIIAKYAMKNETFRRIVSTDEVYHIPATEKQDERNFLTRNRLMWDTEASLYYNGEYICPKYEYATGIKTGYTNAAGNCLVSSAKKDEREVIAVTLKSGLNNRFLDAIKLLEKGLNEYKNITILEKGEHAGTIAIKNGIEPSVDGTVGFSIIKTVPIDWNIDNIDKEVIFQESIEAPVTKGDIIGKIIIRYDGEVLEEVEILANSNIDVSQSVIIKTSIIKGLDKVKLALLGILIFVMVYGMLVMKIRINRRQKRKIRRSKYRLDNDYLRRNILK